MKESISKLRKFGELAGNEMFFKRAKSIEKRLEKMEVLEKVDLNPRSIDLKFKLENRSGNDVIDVEDLTKRFNQNIIFNKANLEIKYGELIPRYVKQVLECNELIQMSNSKYVMCHGIYRKGEY